METSDVRQSEEEGARKLPVKSSRARGMQLYIFDVDTVLLAVIFAIFHENTS